MTPQDFPPPSTLRQAAEIDALCGTEGASIPAMLKKVVASTEGMLQGYQSHFKTARYAIEEDRDRFVEDQPPGARSTVHGVCLLCPTKRRMRMLQQDHLCRSAPYRTHRYGYGFAVDVYLQVETGRFDSRDARWVGSIRGFDGIPFSWAICVTRFAVEEGHTRTELEAHLVRLFGIPTAGNAYDVGRFRK